MNVQLLIEFELIVSVLLTKHGTSGFCQLDHLYCLIMDGHDWRQSITDITTTTEEESGIGL